MDIEKFIEVFHVGLKMACKKTFRTQHVSNKTMTQTSFLVDSGTDNNEKKN
jgi:hypothetical protein